MRHEAGLRRLDYGDERLLEPPASETVNLDAARGGFFEL